MAREQGAVMGYVHTFGFPLPDPATDASLTNALPIDVALGKVDYYEVVGFDIARLHKSGIACSTVASASVRQVVLTQWPISLRFEGLLG
jgi:hypothetical protein